MPVPGDQWQQGRLATAVVVLPEGTTPTGTRGRVLHAALGLFAARGFHGTSIREIGAAAGINSATLYGYYSSKELILAELVLIGHRELHRRLLETVAEVADPVERLTALVRTHVLVHTDFSLLSVVTNSELHVLSAELAAPSLALRAASEQLRLDALTDGVRDGSFDLSDVRLAARAISGMGQRVGNWFGPGQDHTREQVAEAFVCFALRLAGHRER
ncbi:TetR/AcrR family transcriptional regulator [Allokutzneria oryzae]|uniref:TetR/AcrR family transcriptional regulator n=1 Tax=Allokutzneria oryzae TaxID=1378989 RepID=A0ABV5ZTZ9_9PSEU